MTTITSPTATFAELCRMEPRLVQLLRDVEAVKDSGGPSFCANEAWYGWVRSPGFKTRLLKLVGWYAANSKLRTCAAYDLAYDHLYLLLPDCRKCRCIAIEKAIGLRRTRRARAGKKRAAVSRGPRPQANAGGPL